MQASGAGGAELDSMMDGCRKVLSTVADERELLKLKEKQREVHREAERIAAESAATSAEAARAAGDAEATAAAYREAEARTACTD
eukprot:SAG11_NODE_23956_length_380_cov_1.099644_1_plen_84_part_10